MSEFFRVKTHTLFCYACLFFFAEISGIVGPMEHSKANAQHAVQRTLDEALERVGRKLSVHLDRGQRVVNVGLVRGVPASTATSGAFVADQLKAALQRLGIEVDERPSAGEIGGRYRYVNESANDPDGPSQPHARLDFEFILGDSVENFSEIVTDHSDMERLFQRSFYLPISLDLKSHQRFPGPGTEDLEVIGENWVAQRQALAEGFDLRLGVSRLSTLDGKYEPVVISLNQWGRAEAALSKDDSYAVRVFNGTSVDMAIAINIDGFSMFQHMNTDSTPMLTHMIVRAGDSGIIKGWYLSDKQIARFEVGEYMGASKPDLAKVGTIAVSFHVAWPSDGQRPDIYERGLSERVASSQDLRPRNVPLETKKGDVVDKEHKLVRYTWADETLCYLAIRYAN